ncbi:gamma-butyrobetaine hydroxylase-like domain-containing protein [Shimia sp.]|uniref:gamma-butyrobetaine hydroxylase-like domain-containing protein n=1 Tax=Shimia sp. TaxID=1954381 RepID=UPI003B8B6C87
MIDQLTATDDCKALDITWHDGNVTSLPAAYLREQARDAWTIRQKIDFGCVQVAPDLSITALHQFGPAGVNVHFSDGHDHAIYPFVYLRELSDQLDN